MKEGTIISEEQFDKESKKLVENWISAHIIPVRHIVTFGLALL